MARATVTLERGEYGTLQPTLRMQFADRSSRIVSATLHEIAAKAEMATPPSERWLVNISQTEGAVWLELLDGSDREATRGMVILKRVARGWA